MANKWVYRRPSWVFFHRRVFSHGAQTLNDPRGVMGLVRMAFTSGDKFRATAVQTKGGSDLRTVKDGSALTAAVFRS